MKKLTTTVISLSLLTVVVLPVVVFAQTTGHYELLVKDLPFIGNVAPEGGLAGYLNAFFSFGLAIAVLLAVVLFVYNGVVYMTSDVVGSKENAKKAFFGIIGGLILALSTVLILQQINPDLVNFKLFQTLRDVSDTVSTAPPAPPAPPTPPAEEESARLAMKERGVGINQDACQPGQGAPNCINVAGLHPAAIGVLQRLASEIGKCPADKWPKPCFVTITGGTEPGHQTHGVGKPVFDLKSQGAVGLRSYIERNSNQCNDYGGFKLWIAKNSTTYYWLEGTGGEHWHVCVGKNTPECKSFVTACSSVAEGQ